MPHLLLVLISANSEFLHILQPLQDAGSTPCCAIGEFGWEGAPSLLLHAQVSSEATRELAERSHRRLQGAANQARRSRYIHME